MNLSLALYCVSLGKSLDFSEPCFAHHLTGIVLLPCRSNVRMKWKSMFKLLGTLSIIKMSAITVLYNFSWQMESIYLLLCLEGICGLAWNPNLEK